MSSTTEALAEMARRINVFAETAGRNGLPLMEASQRAAQGMAEFERAMAEAGRQIGPRIEQGLAEVREAFGRADRRDGT